MPKEEARLFPMDGKDEADSGPFFYNSSPCVVKRERLENWVQPETLGPQTERQKRE